VRAKFFVIPLLLVFLSTSSSIFAFDERVSVYDRDKEPSSLACGLILGMVLTAAAFAGLADLVRSPQDQPHISSTTPINAPLNDDLSGPSYD
jgi:hypothetical protein